VPASESATGLPVQSEVFDGIQIKMLHAAIAVVCALGLGIDLLEISINGALSTVFSSKPYELQPMTLSWLLASAYLGAVAGAIVAGRVADIKGPRRTLVLAFLWMGVMSILAAARPDPRWFAIFRFLSGAALGACPPIIVAYLTGVAPAKARGMIIFWVSGLAYLMPPLGLFLLRWLTPVRPWNIEGWRWPFFLGGAIALIVSGLFMRLPESYRWLSLAGRVRSADAVVNRFRRSSSFGWLQRRTSDFPHRSAGIPRPALHSKRKRGFARRLLLTIGLYCLQPWAAVSFQLLTGPMLLQRGYKLTDALYYVAIATFGPTVGAFAGGLLVDRWARRTSLLVAGALMGLGAGLFFSSDTRPLLATSVILFAIGVAVYTPVMVTYGAELFSSTVRSTATGVSWAANRLSAVIVPFLVIPLLASHGPGAVCWFVGCSLVLAATLTACGPPGEFGSSLR
jgi:MFS transporter, putative metabolite:H+ symporter